MRIWLRNIFTNRATRDRVLFAAPIALALVILFLFVENREVLASSWRDPMTMLSDRSPGQRDAGALYNIKRLRLSPMVSRPEERVLGVARQRPELPEILPTEAPPLDLIMADEPLMIGPQLIDAQVPGIVMPPDLPRDNTPPGCCGGKLIASVPEPATWLMNIVGLFAIGAALRRRNRRVVATELPGRD
jgi:hypothetical protein